MADNMKHEVKCHIRSSTILSPPHLHAALIHKKIIGENIFLGATCQICLLYIFFVMCKMPHLIIMRRFLNLLYQYHMHIVFLRTEGPSTGEPVCPSAGLRVCLSLEKIVFIVIHPVLPMTCHLK